MPFLNAGALAAKSISGNPPMAATPRPAAPALRKSRRLNVTLFFPLFGWSFIVFLLSCSISQCIFPTACLVSSSCGDRIA